MIRTPRNCVVLAEAVADMVKSRAEETPAQQDETDIAFEMVLVNQGVLLGRESVLEFACSDTGDGVAVVLEGGDTFVCWRDGTIS